MSKMKENEIIALLDKALSEMSQRELVAASEMTDLLLDIRLHLMLTDEAAKVQPQ